MKKDLTGITAKEYTFNTEEDICFSDEGVELCAKIVAKCAIHLQKKGVYKLFGDLKAKVTGSCGRCGKQQVHFDVARRFNYQYILGEEPSLGSEHECRVEDYDRVYLTDPVIESSDVLSEQLVLALPGQILCDDNCKGLCPLCGINQNLESCVCKETHKGSPFAILNTLQKN